MKIQNFKLIFFIIFFISSCLPKIEKKVRSLKRLPPEKGSLINNNNSNNNNNNNNKNKKKKKNKKKSILLKKHIIMDVKISSIFNLLFPISYAARNKVCSSKCSGVRCAQLFQVQPNSMLKFLCATNVDQQSHAKFSLNPLINLKDIVLKVEGYNIGGLFRSMVTVVTVAELKTNSKVFNMTAKTTAVSPLIGRDIFKTSMSTNTSLGDAYIAAKNKYTLINLRKTYQKVDSMVNSNTTLQYLASLTLSRYSILKNPRNKEYLLNTLNTLNTLSSSNVVSIPKTGVQTTQKGANVTQKISSIPNKARSIGSKVSSKSKGSVVTVSQQPSQNIRNVTKTTSPRIIKKMPLPTVQKKPSTIGQTKTSTAQNNMTTNLSNDQEILIIIL